MAATVCGGVFAGVFMDYLIVVACTLQMSSQCATWCRFSHLSGFAVSSHLVWNPPPPPRFVRPPANWSMATREEGVAFEQEDPPTSSRKSPPLCVAFPCSRLVLASSSGPGLKIRLSGSFTVSHLLLIVFDITLMACEQDGEALLIDQSYEC